MIRENKALGVKMVEGNGGETPGEEGMHTIHGAGEHGYVEKVKEEKRVDVWRLKPYECKAKTIDIKTGRKIIVLNEAEAMSHDIYSGYRTEIKHGGHKAVAIVDLSREMVKPGEVGIFRDLTEELGVKQGEKIEIIHLNRPASVEYIKKKLDGANLNPEEIKTIVDDIMDGKLSEVETASWVSSVYIRGFSDDEIVSLTDATVKSGEELNLGKGPILDKHCVGGVAGNRTTMIVVPIIAAAGFFIPKTSSRAITSPAGTADTMEVLANVNFKIDELRDIVRKTHGAIVWGGGLKLAPVDDKLIRIRNPLSLDPEGMLLASILAKKKSVGAQYVLIDVPVGRGAKVPYIERGQELAKHFIKIGKRIGMKVEALITDGAEPIGNGIGPALECRDVLEVLDGRGPEDLRHKALIMAGKLLELCDTCKVNDGYRVAAEMIDNGKAIGKMREIIGMQGGNSKVKVPDLPIGQYTHDIKAEASGQIFHIDNKTISKIARLAGAPLDKGAGVYLYRIRGDRVEKGDKLFTIHATSETKLSFAIKALENLAPIEMRRMLLGSLR